MRSRGLVVAIAVVLAVLAAAGVIIYTSNIEQDVIEGETTQVVVSKQDIQVGTPLGPLVTSGNFEYIRVPNDALVVGAVTVIDDLADETVSAPILANEQIPVTRLSSGPSSNLLGVSKGHVGVGLALGGPQAVNGYINLGDKVVVYATYSKGTPLLQSALGDLLSPQQLDDFYASLAGEGVTNPADQPVLFLPFDFTVTLIQSVDVIAVQNPSVDETSGRRTEGGTLLALDMLPEDATNLVFATGHASLYLGLLNPKDEDGLASAGTVGVPIEKVLGVEK
jgi:Flp pilus assembly protein CpaB